MKLTIRCLLVLVLAHTSQSYTWEISPRTMLFTLFSGALIATIIYHHLYPSPVEPCPCYSSCCQKTNDSTNDATSCASCINEQSSPSQESQPAEYKNNIIATSPQLPEAESEHPEQSPLEPWQDHFYAAGDLFNS